MTWSSPPRPPQERAFIQAVVYAALFDYPLTRAQLHRTLIGEAADEADVERWYGRSAALQHAIEYAEGYFFPRGQRCLLETRARRERISRRLLADLSGPLTLVTHLPFVRLVALSGSLAHHNAEADADLDLFVVTAPGRVWTVAVTALALARLFGWRDRLCLNYIVSERALWVAPADLFSANQLVHLVPVKGRDTFIRLLKENRFVERFYPNFHAPDRELAADHAPARFAIAALESIINVSIGPLVERCCRWLYRAHLRRRAHTWRSADQVRLEPECLKLHTSSHRRDILERFERALGLDRTHADIGLGRFAASQDSLRS